MPEPDPGSDAESAPGSGPVPDGSLPGKEPLPGKEKRPGSRPLWVVVALLLLGAAALWGASRLTWSAELRDQGVRGVVLHTVTGAEQAALLVPFALLALAAVAGMVAVRGLARRILGGVLVLAGLLPAWTAVSTVRFGGQPAGSPVAQMVAGHGLALVGGLLIVVGGGLAVAAGARMPALGAKYSAPGAKKAAADPEKGLWDALTEGEDPTRRR